jgi:hypothetical protein
MLFYLILSCLILSIYLPVPLSVCPSIPPSIHLSIQFHYISLYSSRENLLTHDPPLPVSAAWGMPRVNPNPSVVFFAPAEGNGLPRNRCRGHVRPWAPGVHNLPRHRCCARMPMAIVQLMDKLSLLREENTHTSHKITKAPQNTEKVRRDHSGT